MKTPQTQIEKGIHLHGIQQELVTVFYFHEIIYIYNIKTIILDKSLE